MQPKEEIRQKVWSVMEREKVARFPGAQGRIPNFVGAEVWRVCSPKSHIGSAPEL
jgi:hypothetical protein